MKRFALVAFPLAFGLPAHAGETDTPSDLAVLERRLDALARSNARVGADLALLRRDYGETYSIRYQGPPAGLGAYVEAFCNRKGKNVHVRGVETISVAGVDVTTFECRIVIPMQ